MIIIISVIIYLGQIFNNLIGPLVAKSLKEEKFSKAFISNYYSEYCELLKLLRDGPKIVAISCTHIDDGTLIEITKNIKDLSPGSKIILGGKKFTHLFENIANFPSRGLKKMLSKIPYKFDIISGGLNNQGISNLNPLLRNYITKGNFIPRSINNIIYKEEDGSVNITKLTNSNNLIDFYTNPDWQNYFERSKGKYKVACVQWSIGCPYACRFCWTRIPEKYQRKTLSDLLNEIELLYKLGIRYIYFIDETFTINKDFKLLCEELIKRKIEVNWACCTRLDNFDSESVNLMSASGCRLVFFGIESGCDSILENMNKRNTVDNYYKNLELFKKNKIITFGTFVIGYPGEDKQSIDDTINFLNYSGLDLYRLHLWFYHNQLPSLNRIKKIYNLKGQGMLWKHKTMTSNEATEYFEYIVSNVTNSYIAHITPSIIDEILSSEGWSKSEVVYVYRVRGKLIKLNIEKNINRLDSYLKELKHILNKHNLVNSSEGQYVFNRSQAIQ